MPVEGVHDLLGHADAEVILILARAHVDKRQHRDGASVVHLLAGPNAAVMSRTRDVFERQHEIAGRLEAIGGLLLETAEDDPEQRRRDGRLPRQLGIPGENGADRVGTRVGRKRRAAGDHFVEDRAGREHVGAMVCPLSPQLLGRHVADRAQHGTRHRVPGARLASIGCTKRRGHGRQTEIQDLQASVSRDEDVVGLEIAVDDALVVRRRQPARELQGVVGQHTAADASGRQHASECASIEQLGDGVERGRCSRRSRRRRECSDARAPPAPWPLEQIAPGRRRRRPPDRAGP